MIDFRYHVVSLVAVLLALATGILVGSSLLNQPVIEGLKATTGALARDKEDLRRDVTGLEREVGYRDAYLTSLAPSLIGGRLSGTTVVVVTLPGADGQVADELADTLTDAGGTVTARAAVQPDFVGREKERMLADLTARLALPDVGAGSGQPYARAARQLAGALVTKEAGGPALDSARTALISGLDGAGFVQLSRTPTKRAELVVVVAGAGADSGEGTAAGRAAEASRTGEVAVALAEAFDVAGRGAVVTGPPESADVGRVVATIRAGDAARTVSTVDTAGSPFGRVAVVYALVEQERGGAGQYGLAASADAPLPDLSRSPTL